MLNEIPGKDAKEHSGFQLPVLANTEKKGEKAPDQTKVPNYTMSLSCEPYFTCHSLICKTKVTILKPASMNQYDNYTSILNFLKIVLLGENEKINIF